MIGGTGIIGASLIALFTERCILDRYLGCRVCISVTGRLSRNASGAAAVVFMLIAGSSAAWFTTMEVLRPLGMEYLYTPTLIMFFLLIGFAGELLPFPRRTVAPLNAESGKAVVISSLLGVLTIVPGTGAFSAGLSLTQAAEAGGAFFFIKMLYGVIREKSSSTKDSSGALLYARELAVMGLLALALGGITHMNFFK
jgi:Na+-translocating ferredoxin:NAD+ oxidoreductase RnfA subunit